MRNPSNSKVSRQDFSEAATRFGTDKEYAHTYSRFYPAFLSNINRHDRFTILEIGYGNGSSIPMWRELYPNSFVICADRNVEESGNGYIVIKADQADPTSISRGIPEDIPPIMAIIDDGSHYPEHQLQTFSHLFEDVLLPGGTYIIEDIETSYWLSGELYGHEIRYGLFCRWSAVEVIKLLIDHINRRYMSDKDRSLLEYTMMITGISPTAASLAGSVTFGQNCISVTKALDADLPLGEELYAHAHLTARQP